jgi:hypothetical protein
VALVTWLSFGPRTEHPGALRVDIMPVADVAGDILRLPFRDGAFEAVECHMVIEHVQRDDAPVALGELRRVLAAGGVLELMTVDMAAAARTLLKGDLEILLNIYSPHRDLPQQHRWGYTRSSFTELVSGGGFTGLAFVPVPSDPHAMCVQAHKP